MVLIENEKVERLVQFKSATVQLGEKLS